MSGPLSNRARICTNLAVALRVAAFALSALLPLASAPPALAQRDALTLPRNLAGLMSETHLAVRGHVLSVSAEPHPQLANLMTLVVTISVDETLKGTVQGTYTFRQAVLDRRDLLDRFGYRPGQHLLLLMREPSRYGLSSPAGLEQGRFLISTTSDGKMLVANRMGNAGLFRNLAPEMKAKGLRVPAETQALVEKTAAGPLPYDHLKNLIQALAASQ